MSLPRAVLGLCALASLACSGPQSRPQSGPPQCGDVAAWRADAIARASGPQRSQLEAWQPSALTPPASRAAVVQVAKDHLDTCGTEETLALATRLISFQTVSAHRDAGSDPEFGKMADFLRGWAAERGMSFRTYGLNDVWELSLGEGAPGIGFLAHGDVVPASEQPAPALANPKGIKDPKASSLPPGWTHAPFAAERVGDRLYGRGSEDDKGPLAAALVVMDTLRRFGLQPAMRTVAIVGNGEEFEWDPMEAYAKETPPPRFTISVDADFPLVVAEHGWVGWHLTAPLRPGKAIRCAEIVDARGGEFITQVPAEAMVRLRAGAAEGVEALLARAKKLAAEEAAARGAPFGAEAFQDRDSVVVRTRGVPVHTAMPEKGANALWPLARIVSAIGVCEGGAGSLLRLIGEKFDGDHYGTNLRIGYSDPIQGQLVSVPSVLRVEHGVATLAVNLRRPGGMSNEAFTQRLDALTAELGRSYGIGEDLPKRIVGDPHVTDPKGPLASTLLEIYRRESGNPAAQPLAIRGGTYARLFPGSVSFGPALPGKPYLGHSPDEWIEISALRFQMKVLLEAAVQLDALLAKGSR